MRICFGINTVLNGVCSLDDFSNSELNKEVLKLIDQIRSTGDEICVVFPKECTSDFNFDFFMSKESDEFKTKVIKALNLKGLEASEVIFTSQDNLKLSTRKEIDFMIKDQDPVTNKYRVYTNIYCAGENDEIIKPSQNTFAAVSFEEISEGILLRKESKYQIPNMNPWEYIKLLNKDYKEKLASIFGERRIPYYEQEKITENLIAGFKKIFDEIGIKPGDHVGYLMPNSPSANHTIFALLALGVSIDLFNADSPKELMKSNLNKNKIKFIVVDDQSLDSLDKIKDETCLEKIAVSSLNDDLAPGKTFKEEFPALQPLRNVQIPDDSRYITLKGVEHYGLGYEFEPVSYNPKTIALRALSSASTADPKGICVTYENIMSYVHSYVRSGPGANRDEEHIMIGSVPKHSITGVVPLTIQAAAIGWVNCCIPDINPFNLPYYVSRYKINTIVLAPPFFQVMLGSGVDLSNQKLWISCGMKLNADDEIAIRDGIRTTIPEFEFRQAFGASEMTSAGACDKDPNVENLPGYCGTAFDFLEIEIRDIETHKLLGPNKIGEPVFSGMQLMAGYDKGELTDKVMWVGAEDGKRRYNTTDKGVMTEQGNLQVSGRLIETISRLGYYIDKPEIEEIISDFSGVKSKYFEQLYIAKKNLPNNEGSVPVVYYDLKPEFKSASNLTEIKAAIERELMFNFIDRIVPLNTPVKVLQTDFKTTSFKVDVKSLDKMRIASQIVEFLPASPIHEPELSLSTKKQLNIS